jgi:hypothetical protein
VLNLFLQNCFDSSVDNKIILQENNFETNSLKSLLIIILFFNYFSNLKLILIEFFRYEIKRNDFIFYLLNKSFNETYDSIFDYTLCKKSAIY